MNNETKQRLLGLLSHLLQYPDSEWRERLPDVREELESAPDDCRREIAAFLDEAEAADGVTWQDRYVRTFDFGKKSNMYLTYGRHGEERERGPALLELKRRYAEAGFELVGSELPDYLPLMLEFGSAATWEAAECVFAGAAAPLSAIREQLEGERSPYAALFGLLLQIVETMEPASDLEAAPAGSGVK